MGIETTSTLTDSLIARYLENYLDAAESVRLYDQISIPVGKDMEVLKRGSSVYVPFLSDMEPGSSAIL